MRKSGLDGGTAAECGNEIDPRLKPAPAVAVGFLENAEDLEPPNDVLYGQSHPRHSTTVYSLGGGKRVMLARATAKSSG